MKFATKLLLALAGTIAAGTAVLVPVIGNRTGKLLERQIVARLENNARHMIDKLDRYIEERMREGRSLAAEKYLSSSAASPGDIAAHLQEFLHGHREYLSAALVTMDRVKIADTGGGGVGGRDDSDDCWAELAAGRDAAVCVRRSAPGESPTLRLAFLVRDGGAARGVLVLRLPIGVLEEQLRGASELRGPSDNLHVDLVDRAGVVLYSNYLKEGILSDISPDWGFLREQLDVGRSSGVLRYTNPAEETGEEFLVFVRQPGFRDFPGSGWTLILFEPTRAVLAPVRDLQIGVAVAVLTAGAVLLGVLLLLVRSFSRPIEALRQAAREIGGGNLAARVPVDTHDELGVLAETFNRMAADTQESHRALDEIRRDLQGQVEERTEELLHTNELLHAKLSERVKAQELLAERERLLRLSADIGEALTIGQSSGPTLQLCANFIARDLDVAFFRIWTLGEEEGVLQLRASAGLYTRLDGEHSRKIVGEQKIGVIAREKRPILTNAVLGDPAITDQEWARREGMNAFAGHPLVVDGKCVGVMACFARRPLGPSVVSALAAVADKIATFVGRKQAEDLLSVSEKRYRELIDASSDGIYRTDAHGLFTAMNRAGVRMFGYENPEEMIGRPALDFWLGAADREAFVNELRLRKSVSAYRVRARRRSGELLELECSSRILEGDDGSFLGIEGVLRDVTERARAEAERELLIAQLQEAAANIKTLNGLLPICAGCKKIRDEQGTWSQVETYVKSHSNADFSHGLCPDCRKTYFPGFG